MVTIGTKVRSGKLGNRQARHRHEIRRKTLTRKLALSLCLLAPVSAGAQDLSPNAQLLVAARQGDLAAAKRLLEGGAAVNSRNRLGDTPLLIALKNGHKGMARLAVERGASVNLANLSSVTPLMAASFSGNAELVKILLEKGAKRAPADRVGKTAMVYAAGLGHTEVVELLLADGESARAAYRNDLTALRWAAAYDHTGTVKLLLERGADASAHDDRGRDGGRRRTQGNRTTAPQSRRRAINHRTATGMKPFLRAGAAVLLVWGLRAEAQFVDPSLRWRTLDTAHFSVHFAEHTRAQGELVASVAESVYPRVTGWLKWAPESRTQIVVLDSLDFSNGYASPYPFNFIGIILSPPDEGELLQNREWLELVLTHEFTHIVHLDKASRGPLLMRRIFGRAPPYFLLFFPNTLPNVWGPNWVKEGLAVYAESDWNKGWGRLGQSHFEGMMRAETARGPISLRELHAEGRGFPHNRDYLYGSYFFLFLGERYGPQAIVNYVENYSDNFFPYRMHSNTVAITGKPQDTLWLEYEEWLRARFAAKAQDPGRRPDQGGEIIARAYSLTSPLLTRESERWYVQGDGYTLPKVMRQAAGGEVEPVLEIELMTRLWASPRGEVLLSKLEICRNYNYYYDLYR